MLRVSKRPVVRRSAFQKASETPDEVQLTELVNAAWEALGKPDLNETILNSLTAGQIDPFLKAMHWLEFTQKLREAERLMQKAFYESSVGQLRVIADLIAEKFNGINMVGAPSIDLIPSFTMLDQYSIDWAAQYSGGLVVEISDEVRENIRQLVTDSMGGIYTPQELARQIKTIIPLHTKWANAVIKFQDRTYKRLIKEGADVAVAKAKALAAAEKYAAKLTRLRSRTIARTEIMTSMGEGHVAGWNVADSLGMIGPGWMKEWLTAEDEQVCSLCGPLDHQQVPWNGNFSWGGITSPRHPNCRCDVALVPTTPAGVMSHA